MISERDAGHLWTRGANSEGGEEGPASGWDLKSRAECSPAFEVQLVIKSCGFLWPHTAAWGWVSAGGEGDGTQVWHTAKQVGQGAENALEGLLIPGQL